MRAIKCDGCGKTVDRATMDFCIEHAARATGGNIITPEHEQIKWDHRQDHGDLCSDCAEPVIAVLNDVLGEG